MMTTEEIIAKITSGDTLQVWEAARQIISLSQERDTLLPLFPFLPSLVAKAGELALEAEFAPKQRCIEDAIRVIEFHRAGQECRCELYVWPISLAQNPAKEEEKGHITILDTTLLEEQWVDFYKVACTQCGEAFKVFERDYHYTWWHWTKWKFNRTSP